MTAFIRNSWKCKLLSSDGSNVCHVGVGVQEDAGHLGGQTALCLCAAPPSGSQTSQAHQTGVSTDTMGAHESLNGPD